MNCFSPPRPFTATNQANRQHVVALALCRYPLRALPMVVDAQIIVPSPSTSSIGRESADVIGYIKFRSRKGFRLRHFSYTYGGHVRIYPVAEYYDPLRNPNMLNTVL